MAITVKPFDALTAAELYDILEARCAVFVVEQNCPYLDIDGLDKTALHVLLPHQGKLGAYCRLLPPDTQNPWRIGRVLTTAEARGQKLAHLLMHAALAEINARGGQRIKLSAQAHLQAFYESHGFIAKGDTYLEDGIPHIGMVRG